MYYTRFDSAGRSTGFQNTPPEDMTDVYEIEDELVNKTFRLEDGVVREETEEEVSAYMSGLQTVAAAVSVRFERTLKLSATDSLMLSDRWALFSTSLQTSIAAYRAALRDLPEQEGFPNTIEWPVNPVE